MLPEYKKKVLLQLKKASGTLNKVMDMVEGNEYCIDVLQQNLAALGLLKSANKTILENHLNSCFKKGVQGRSKKPDQKLIEEILKIVNKL